MNFIVTVVIFILSVSTWAKDSSCEHTATEFHCVKYISNADGDTVKFDIPDVHPLIGKNIAVRVFGIDSPEISSKEKCEKESARIAKNLAESLLKSAKRIDIIQVKKDKFFRLLGDVIIDGKSLSEVMLKNRLAYPYFGKTKQQLNWCEYSKQDRVPTSEKGK